MHASQLTFAQHPHILLLHLFTQKVFMEPFIGHHLRNPIEMQEETAATAANSIFHITACQIWTQVQDIHGIIALIFPLGVYK